MQIKNETDKVKDTRIVTDHRRPTLAERRAALRFREPSAEERRAVLASTLDDVLDAREIKDSHERVQVTPVR